MASALDFVLRIVQRVSGNAAAELKRTETAIKSTQAASVKGAKAEADAVKKAEKEKANAVRAAEQAKNKARQESAAHQKEWLKGIGIGEETQQLARAGLLGKAMLGLKTAFKVAAVGAAVFVASLAAVGAALSFGVKAFDAARNLRLTAQAMTESTSAGNALAASWAKIEYATGVGADALQGWTRQLQAAKLKGNDLALALKALALQQAATGEADISGFIDQLKAGKTTAEKFAKTMSEKFGGIVAQKMNGLEGQLERMKLDIASVFSGADAEPFLRALKQITGLLSETTASGRRNRAMLLGMFTAMLEGAMKAIPYVRLGLTWIAVGVLRAYNHIKNWPKGILKALGIEADDTAVSLRMMGEAAEIAMYAAMVPVFILFGAVLVLAAAWYGLKAIVSDVGGWERVKAVLWGVALVILALVGIIFLPIAVFALLISSIISLFTGSKNWLWNAGVNVVQGFIDGISSMLSAVTGVGNKVTATFKSSVDAGMGNASPSKEMKKRGRFAGQGLAIGAESTVPQVRNASESMTKGILGGADKGAKESPKGGGVTLNVTLTINASSDPDAIAESVRQELSTLLEQYA